MRDLRHLPKPSPSRLASDEDGLAILFWALSLPFILLFLALVADTGLATVEKRELQNAVDAAALAGAQELPDATAAAAVAQRFVEDNLSTDPAELTIAVSTPYNGDAALIEVTVTGPAEKLLGGDYALGPDTVSARAVARQTVGGGAGYALLALSESDCRAFDKGGSSNLIIKLGGRVMVNSDCDNSSNGATNRVAGGDIDVGGFDYYYEGTVTENGSGNIIPDATPVSSIVPDPLATMIPPSLVAPVSPDSGGTEADPDTLHISASSDTTLSPGVYHGGLSLAGSGNITMLPGVYVMAGGGFSYTGSGEWLAEGVMIYNADPATPAGPPGGPGHCQEVNLRGSGEHELHPATTGPYAYVAIWQAADCDESVKLEGGSDAKTGVIYAPSATVDFVGGGDLGSVQIIADAFDINGSGDMLIDFVEYIEIPAGKQFALVE